MPLYLISRACQHLLDWSDSRWDFLFRLFEKRLFGHTDFLDLSVRKRNLWQRRIRRRWRRRNHTVIWRFWSVDNTFWRSRCRQFKFCCIALIGFGLRAREVELCLVVVVAAAMSRRRQVDSRGWRWRNDEAWKEGRLCNFCTRCDLRLLPVA